MAGYRAFVATDPNNNQYLLTYYHNPDRWRDNMVDIDSPISKTGFVGRNISENPSAIQ